MAKLERTVADGAVASGLVSEADLARVRAELGDAVDDQRMLQGLVERGLLTKWQAAQLKSGRVQNLVLGNYHLLSHLGAGGMGAVFRARDRRLGREVAIKILPPSAATPEAVGRFRREALAALQLRHEHVVASFELAQQGSIHYLVMELVDGPSLAALLDKKKRLSVRESARIGQEVALALEHARQQGIVHRDIKPSNILLSRQGTVKVADLGLAKFFGPQARASGPETRTGQFMGTIDYCAPEQAQDAKRADIRSDIYSLGCTLYHCLTGKPPFHGGTEVERIMAHIELLPADIRSANQEVPPALAEMIEKRMLAKQPAERFQTPAEAAEALAPWARGEHGASVNLWAALAGLDELLEEASPAPVHKPKAQRDRETRPSRRRPAQTLRAGGAGKRLGPKDASVLAGPLGYAAVALVVLATITAGSLLWPRTKIEAPLAVASVVGDGAGDAPASPSQAEKDGNIAPASEQPSAGNAADDAADDAADGGREPLAADPLAAIERTPAQGDAPPGGDASNMPEATTPRKPSPSDGARSAADIGTEKTADTALAPKPPGLVLTVKHGASVGAVAVSADGSMLLTGGADNVARVWHGADGTPRGSPLVHRDVDRTNAGWYRTMQSVSFSSDGRYAITQNFGGITPGLWDLSRAGAGESASVAIPGPTPFKLVAMAFSADAKEVAALGFDNRLGIAVRIFQLSNGAWRDTPLKFPGKSQGTLPTAFSADLRRLAMGGGGVRGMQSEIAIYWAMPAGKMGRKPLPFEEGDFAVRSAFRPDGRSLAILHGNGKLQLVHVPGASPLKEFKLAEAASQFAFSPRGDLLACVGRASGAVELLNAETGDVRGPRSPIKKASAVDFSPDGRQLFVGNRDGTATLWRLDALLQPRDSDATEQVTTAAGP